MSVIVSTDPQYTFVATTDVHLTAVFEEVPVYTITATIDPAGSGTVTGAGQYQEGETCTLVATVADGYEFTGWSENGDIVSTDVSYAFMVTSDRMFTAVFYSESYTFLEYAETSGSKCEIDTGIKVTLLTSRIVMDVMPISFSKNYDNYIFIVPNWMGLYSVDGSNCSFWHLSWYNRTMISKSIIGQRTTIEFDGNNKVLKIGNSSYSILNNVTNTNLSSDSLMIFTNNRCPTKIRIYSAKVYVGNDLIGDIAPAQKSDGEVGLYNKVTKEFYKNKENGYYPLTAGPTV